MAIPHNFTGADPMVHCPWAEATDAVRVAKENLERTACAVSICGMPHNFGYLCVFCDNGHGAYFCGRCGQGFHQCFPRPDLANFVATRASSCEGIEVFRLLSETLEEEQ